MEAGIPAGFGSPEDTDVAVASPVASWHISKNVKARNSLEKRAFGNMASPRGFEPQFSMLLGQIPPNRSESVDIC